jgi:hypothetical protein
MRQGQPITNIGPPRKHIRVQGKSKFQERNSVLRPLEIKQQAVRLRDESLGLLGIQFKGPVKAPHFFVVIAYLVIRTGQVLPDSWLPFVEFGCHSIVFDWTLIFVKRTEDIGEVIEEVPGVYGLG